MVEEKILGTVKRLGARYGRGVKHKLAKVEAVRKAKKKCPYCHAWKIQRISRGIWQCKKCKAKFTGKAYTIAEKIVIKEEITEKKEGKNQEEEKTEKKE